MPDYVKIGYYSYIRHLNTNPSLQQTGRQKQKEVMVSLIRGLFGQALKTNEFLKFAVLTGCLRISKESIFTGLNNFKILFIADTRFDGHFGFTETDVAEILKDYQLEGHLADSRAEPEAFWINTSGNDLVKRFINKADKTTQNEIERLIAGETIEKKIRLDLAYDELDTVIYP